MRSDVKGFAFGLSLAFAGFGAANLAGEGRFQIESAGTDNSAVVYLLDTTTGDVWREQAGNALVRIDRATGK